MPKKRRPAPITCALLSDRHRAVRMTPATGDRVQLLRMNGVERPPLPSLPRWPATPGVGREDDRVRLAIANAVGCGGERGAWTGARGLRPGLARGLRALRARL